MPYKWKNKQKEYQKKYHAKWYKENKEKVIENKKKVVAEKKKWWVEYKTTLSCIRCGSSHPAILDFHHRDGKEKENMVSRLVVNNLSKKRILAEVAKCDVLCSNCHRIEHWEKRGRHDMWDNDR